MKCGGNGHAQNQKVAKQENLNNNEWHGGEVLVVVIGKVKICGRFGE